VVDPPVHQPEHVREDVPVPFDQSFRDSHDRTELAIYRLVHAERETESEGTGDARVALDDVAVVPDPPLALMRAGRSRDRASLKDVQGPVAGGESPLDVLRHAEDPAQSAGS